MKPIIGILASVNDERKTNLVYSYVKAVVMAGGIPVILPNNNMETAMQDHLQICGGFLFTGGGDVEPSLYGAEKSPACGPIQPLRDEFDFTMLKGALRTGKPILGICRGIQVINVALGGTLYQDLPTERPSAIRHQQIEGYSEPSHGVSVVENSVLHRLTGAARLQVNSFHHQAIHRLADGLEAVATADDGVIEAVTAPDFPYLRGYQWHPERLVENDPLSLRLFEDFIHACGRLKGEGET